MDKNFLKRLEMLKTSHEKLINRTNEKAEEENGISCGYKNPVLSAHPTPV